MIYGADYGIEAPEALWAYLLSKQAKYGRRFDYNNPDSVRRLTDELNEIWENNRTPKQIKSLIRRIRNNKLSIEDFIESPEALETQQQ